MGLRARYEEVVQGLLGELRAHYGAHLVSVAVFGSVARGTQREDSDIDFLVVAHDLPRGRTARVAEFLPVEQRLAALAVEPPKVHDVGPLLVEQAYDDAASVVRLAARVIDRFRP